MDLKSIWTVRVTHDYFESQRGNWVDITPTRETEVALRRRGIIFRRMNDYEWSLIQLMDGSLSADDVFDFDFRCTDSSMVHKTIWDWNTRGVYRQIEIDTNSNSCIDMSTIPGEQIRATTNALCRLRVPLGRIAPNSPITTELHFTAKSYYWEYWLVPRDQNVGRDIVLEVEGADVQFNRMEDSSSPLNMPLVKFRSTSPLKVKDRGRERISLYERISADVKRPVLRSLPLPEPGRFPFDTQDTVVAITYI